MTTSLRILDEKTFMEAGTRMEARIICVRSSLPPRLYASAYRFIGTTQFFKGDEEAARSWFRSALELEPEFYWDAGDLVIGHPLRSAMEISHDGDFLLTGDHDHRLHLYARDAAGRLTHLVSQPFDGTGVHSARWSPDDRLVARTASNLDRLQVFAVGPVPPP